jgi:shikimate dehydrogenase
MSDEVPGRRMFLLGRDIQHSFSPKIWNGVFGENQLPWLYELRDIDETQLPGVLADLKDDAFLGCSVTMPYKQWAFSQAQERNRWVERAGVCNWLSLHEGRLVSANTDAEGTSKLLRETGPSELALVLGAGGAAGAVLAALESRVDRVVVTSRSRSRAECQAARVQPWLRGVSVVDWDDRMRVARDADLIVNATSVGMAGRPGTPLEDMKPREGLRILDAVYGAKPTDLERQADRWGARFADGLAFLEYQATVIPSLIGLDQVTSDIVRRHVEKAVGRVPRRWTTAAELGAAAG